MKKAKNKFSLYGETCIFLCAFSAFVLFLLFATLFTDCCKDTSITYNRHFDIYSWRYNKPKIGGIKIADICGKGVNEDNAFIHIRREPNGFTEVVFWLYDGKFTRGHYKILTEFEDKKEIHKTDLRVGGNGDLVLFLKKPHKLIGKMKQSKTFKFYIILNNDTLDCYTYQSFEELQWD